MYFGIILGLTDICFTFMLANMLCDVFHDRSKLWYGGLVIGMT